ncbi:MAG: tRNA adenosine(34) deaminase TadA [Gammaproteobacteria bacterium]
MAATAELDELYMRRALELAACGEAEGEVPVGAVLVHEGRMIAATWNRPISHHDPTAHAEILALRSGGQALGNYRLTGTTLYVTLEPCAMCAGAMVHARIARLVYGARDPRAGAVDSMFGLLGSAELNHRVAVTGGVLAAEASAQLQGFFRARRKAAVGAGPGSA